MIELKAIARHTGTVLVGQLAVMAYGVTDTLVAGRHSEAALAALSVGSAIFISVYVGLMGVLQALLPVWAELHGARKFPQLGRSVRQAMYLCGCAMAVGVTALLFPDGLMRWTQVPPALQSEVERYLMVLAVALPPALLFRVFSTLNQALGKPVLVTWLQAGSLFLKIPLSIWFAFGGLGLAPQGAVGCAWATLVVNYTLLGLAVWMLRTQDFYRPYAIWRRLELPDWPQIRAFARLGIPGGLAIMVEVTSFTLMALFISRQGLAPSASHQIASNLAAVLYMLPLSLGLATSSRASYWLGAGHPKKASATVITGLKLTLGAAIGMSALLWMGRNALASAYATNSEVISLAVTLLVWVAIYHLFDAVQAVCVFVLRCYRITLAPLLVYCVLLWGVGLGGGYLLAYHGLSGTGPYPTPVTFWAASTGALAVTAFIFLFILWRAMHQPNATAQRP